MTNKQLQRLLAKFPEEHEIIMRVNDDDATVVITVEEVEGGDSADAKTSDAVVEIIFHPEWS